MSVFRILILALIAMLLHAQSQALNVLVQTTARSASGEPVGVAQQVVNLRARGLLPGVITLPGAVAYHPTRYNSPATYGIVTVGPARVSTTNAPQNRTILTTFRASPLSIVPNELLERPRGWKIVNAFVLKKNSPTTDTLLLLEQSEKPHKRAGRVSILRGDLATGTFPTNGVSTWDLDGIPVDACLSPDGATIIVLCEDIAGTKSFLQIQTLNALDLEAKTLELRLAQGQFGSVPVAVTTSPSGAQIVALTSGYQTQQASGQIVSWVHIVDASALSEPQQPLPLPGSALLADEPFHPGASNSLWIATHSPGAGFAYVSHLQLSGERPKFLANVPFSGVRGALKMAPSPDRTDIAVAADQRLEIWHDGKPGDASRTFVAPISALIWTPDGIVVGEAGRIHLVAPQSLELKRSVQLQSGHVTEISPLYETAGVIDRDGDGLSPSQERSLGTKNLSADTDGDGIPDGVDPEPKVPSPILNLPSSVTLRGEAAGREVLTFPLGSPQTDTLSIRFDKGAMRWVKVSTSDSSFDGPRLELSLDPLRYLSTEDRWMSGVLTVQKDGTRPGVHAAGSPARIVIDVAPSTGGVRKILWVWSEHDDARSLRSPASAQRFSELAEMLAGPPNHYSHQGVWGPFEEPIDSYDTIFITMNAAAEGALTRHVILDYVSRGGSLLLVAGHGNSDTFQAIERWLEPAGITLDIDDDVRGAFPNAGIHEVSRNWTDFSIRDGCVIYTGEDVTAAVPGQDGANTAILALRPFGFGRIAVLASGTPLENGEIQERNHARFAQDLFRWLTSGRYTIRDQDGDGIPDYLEDTNRNGIADAGETDFLNPDSDGDRIPDGAEDKNRNGTVDEGETNPRNADSDNDGIEDGADAFPIPLPGMPQIASLNPQSGPAQGGTEVVFRGLNFPTNASVWFGDQRSDLVRRLDSTHLIAVSPPAPPTRPETPVAVRILDTLTDREALLPSGFQYTARGQVGLALDLLRVARRQYQTYTGAMAIVIDTPDVNVGRIAFNLRVRPIGAIENIRTITSPELRSAHRELKITQVAPSTFRIATPRGMPLTGRTNLGTVQWTTVKGAVRSEILFEITAPIIMAQSGGRTLVEAYPLTVQLPRRTSARPSPR